MSEESKMSEEIKAIYVYCHDCKQLISKCHHYIVAYAAEEAHREVCPNSTITTGSKGYFEKAFPDLILEPKVVITVWRGCVEVDSKPDNIDILVKDYDVEESWDEDNLSCKEDDNGRYQEMIF